MRRVLIFIIITLFLCGCTYYAPTGKNHAVRVVTQVDVLSTQGGQLQAYHYTDGEKVQAILSYLRKLSPDRQTPITPDTFRTDAYQIVLTLSDGSQSVYCQIYDEYLQKNSGPWRSIDRVQGAVLPHLLSKLPSDQL